jgi:hypothetical protein
MTWLAENLGYEKAPEDYRDGNSGNVNESCEFLTANSLNKLDTDTRVVRVRMCVCVGHMFFCTKNIVGECRPD